MIVSPRPFWLKLQGGGRHCTHHRGTVSALAGHDVSLARESRLTPLVRRPHPVRPPAALARPPEGLLLATGGRHYCYVYYGLSDDIHIGVSLSVSLSLSLYIYIYTYIS